MKRRVLDFVSKPDTPLATHREEQAKNMRATLQELYILLEDFAPVWYTQGHHDRALCVLLERDS